MSLSGNGNDGFNVEYCENFLSKDYANSLYNELINLEYKQLTVKVFGKTYTPKRKVLAFGDDGVSYSFSNTTVKPEKWLPSIVTVKKMIEEKTGELFNYVLLNLYENGQSRIGQHKDNEPSLDPEASIPTLSLGTTRNVVFKRKNHVDTSLPLHHGSLLLMKKPTNELYSHGIPTESRVMKPRISLTFRRIKTEPKKQKLKHVHFSKDEDEIPENDWMHFYVQNSTEFDCENSVKQDENEIKKNQLNSSLKRKLDHRDVSNFIL